MCRSSDSSLDQKVLQQSSEISVLKSELKALKEKNQQLIDIHIKYKSKKDQISVATQTDEVNM